MKHRAEVGSEVRVVSEGPEAVRDQSSKRSRIARKNREPHVGKPLRAGRLDAANFVRDWDLAYKKECFYLGLRALFELEWHGGTKF